MKNKLVQKLKDIYYNWCLEFRMKKSWLYNILYILRIFILLIGFIFILSCVLIIGIFTLSATELGMGFSAFILFLIGMLLEMFLFVVYYVNAWAWSLK